MLFDLIRSLIASAIDYVANAPPKRKPFEPIKIEKPPLRDDKRGKTRGAG